MMRITCQEDIDWIEEGADCEDRGCCFRLLSNCLEVQSPGLCGELSPKRPDCSLPPTRADDHRKTDETPCSPKTSASPSDALTLRRFPR